MSSDFGQLDTLLENHRKHSEEYGGDDAFKHEVRGLAPTETMFLRFIGGAKEPKEIWYHGFSQMNGMFDSAICLGEGQICCQKAALRGEQRIKRRSQHAAYSVFSCRAVYKVPDQNNPGKFHFEVRRMDRNNRALHWARPAKGQPYQLQVYQNVAPGAHPLDGHQWELEGRKVWRGSTWPKAQNCANISALIKELRQRCRCNGTVGTGINAAPAAVVVRGYSCAKCRQVLTTSQEQATQYVTCPHCQFQGLMEESLACTANCAQPKRASLTDCYVRVTLEGMGNEKLHRFEHMPFSAPEAEHVEHLYKQVNGVWVPNSFDLDEMYKPSEKIMHELMLARGLVSPAVQNPGAPGGGWGPQAAGAPFGGGGPGAPPPGQFGGPPQGQFGGGQQQGAPTPFGGGFGGQAAPPAGGFGGQQQGGGYAPPPNPSGGFQQAPAPTPAAGTPAPGGYAPASNPAAPPAPMPAVAPAPAAAPPPTPAAASPGPPRPAAPPAPTSAAAPRPTMSFKNLT